MKWKMANKRIDRETGELEDENYKERLTFNYHNIPREIKEELLSKQEKNLSDKRLKDLLPLREGTAFGEINPVFLFLPAIIYFKWFAISLMIFEVIFHGWSHHKNKSLKDVYYRSPFHGITSEYCALCQFETCMIRVEKMQQIRMHKFLYDCNYMKRAVT
ncbi:uncharacterized protein LOC141528520 isoform X2 [Cotesia typhae]|uniref:uncharacterized protein LOC141528520 isoform X2 n=1 Tax=Cotesia typhae TaxID=2053667 RepID=UPI003D68A2AD